MGDLRGDADQAKKEVDDHIEQLKYWMKVQPPRCNAQCREIRPESCGCY